MQWNDLAFNELSTNELYDLMKLRVDIFVVEQQCAYPELDEQDRHPQTRHLLGLTPQGQLVAYARLLSPVVPGDVCRIGRIAVSQTARGKGTARELMANAIELTSGYWPDSRIKISAQVYLQKFYQQLGFRAVSEPYLEDGIPHMDMLMKIREP